VCTTEAIQGSVPSGRGVRPTFGLSEVLGEITRVNRKEGIFWLGTRDTVR
jgi:hypothetical protein